VYYIPVFEITEMFRWVIAPVVSSIKTSIIVRLIDSAEHFVCNSVDALRKCPLMGKRALVPIGNGL
jgi:hypothetical protein